MSATTELTITGHGADTQTRTALVRVNMKDSTHQNVFTVNDGVSVCADDSINRYKYPNQDAVPPITGPASFGIPTPTEVVAEINERFNAAGVSVSTTNTSYLFGINPDAPCNIVLLASMEWTDIKGIQRVAMGRTKLPNTIFLNYGWFHGRGPRTDDIEGVRDSMARTAAHESGHLLSLSTREHWNFEIPYLGHEFFDEENANPLLFGPKVMARALMRDGLQGAPGRWMRHEDWKAANEKARDILK